MPELNTVEAGPPVADASAEFNSPRVSRGFPRIHALLSAALDHRGREVYLRWLSFAYRTGVLSAERKLNALTLAYVEGGAQAAGALAGLASVVLGGIERIDGTVDHATAEAKAWRTTDHAIVITQAWNKVRMPGALDEARRLARVGYAPEGLLAGYALEAHGFGRYLFDLREINGLFAKGPKRRLT